MQEEQTIQSFLTLFSILSFFVTLFIYKISDKIGNGILLDQDFIKPQAFHKNPIARSGGLVAIILLSIFFMLYYLLFNNFLYQYFIICIAFFTLGFLDDIKIKINPNTRLALMIIVLITSITYFSIDIERIDLVFLENWLQNKIFQTFFILLCFLFIINGSNLIDGFNGLLVIHLLIINLVILSININGDKNFVFLIIGQIIILFLFLLFNFPKAKMFFGDSGSYLFGSLTVMNIIETNNKNPEISSFFFCVILFYLFFEVFFSFFRKLLLKKSPLKPDDKHLHMLFYKYLERSGKFIDSNYITSLFINLIYAFFTLPIIFFKNNGIVCRYWFFSLLILYIIFYLRIYSFTKK
tara:strand:- start:1952 stop:3010 length:1059 start_codon:yes stop_codon:yes gene_type:complete